MSDPSTTIEELGRVDLAKHKHAFVVVGYDADGDICIGIGEERQPSGYDPTVAPMSPQATMKVLALLATALKQRGDD